MTKIAGFSAVLLAALVAGVFWGTWFTLTRSLESFSPAEFLHIGKTIIANVAVPMRILLPLALFAMVWVLLVERRQHAPGFPFTLAALGLMVATLLITLLVEVPIDNQIRNWTVENLPADFETKRLTWKEFHAWRTLTSVASVAALVWGTLTDASGAVRPAAPAGM